MKLTMIKPCHLEQPTWHRCPDYIYGISSFEEIASILNSLLPNER